MLITSMYYFSDIYIFKIIFSFLKTFEKVKISNLIADEVD